MRISTIRHPEYEDDSNDFFKWRLTYKGGRHFIDAYLERFSERETDAMFRNRRKISYAPTYAKAAINKLKNTFYSRMCEIKRLGGPDSYIKAAAGEEGGVDLYGTSLSAFIGQEVLAELMTMKRVGVYVDRKPLNGPTIADNKGNKPYLYYYKTEDILTWEFYYYEGEYLYRNVLLRDYEYETDPKTGMVTGTYCRYRQVWLADDGRVHIQMWKESEDAHAEDDIKVGDEIITELTRIPFVIAALQESLLADVCAYQVAYMNVASADINYVYHANFPFYTEEFDPVAESVYNRRGAVLPPQLRDGQPYIHDPNKDNGTATSAQATGDSEVVQAGGMKGRRFPKGAKPPSFIAPPTEPLMASMAKQNQMRDEIFELVDIAASNAQPQHASADSKQMDNQGLESGLSYIGLELEYLEREIAKVWAQYENSDPATINYPEKYTLKSDAERIAQATALNEVKMAAPSLSAQKEIAKQIAHIMLVDKVPRETLEKIFAEIDAAEYVSSDPEMIQIASELGMVDAVTGSNALGFNGKKIVPLAQKEHAERLKVINDAQAAGKPDAARGVPDNGPTAGKDAAAAAGNGK